MEQLRKEYQRGGYMAMQPYVETAQFEPLLKMLLTVDELLAANAGALDAIGQIMPGASVEAIDLAPVIRNNLGLFSMDLQVLEAHEDAGAATIAVQVADQIDQLQFRNRDGVWVYLPGHCPDEVTGCLRQIAVSLNHIRTVVLKKNLTAAQVQEEYDVRIRPKLQRAAELAARSQPADSGPASSSCQSQPSSGPV